MKSKVDSIEKFERVQFSDVPNGEYQGTWSGYTVMATINGVAHRLKTENGLRGIAPCVILSYNGDVFVESLSERGRE